MPSRRGRAKSSLSFLLIFVYCLFLDKATLIVAVAEHCQGAKLYMYYALSCCDRDTYNGIRNDLVGFDLQYSGHSPTMMSIETRKSGRHFIIAM